VERVSQIKRRRRRAKAGEWLKRENERLRRALAAHERRMADQAKQIAEKARQIAGLERQLALRNQNSTITSKPPASDGLAGRHIWCRSADTLRPPLVRNVTSRISTASRRHTRRCKRRRGSERRHGGRENKMTRMDADGTTCRGI
jgi:hypothetical protein